MTVPRPRPVPAIEKDIAAASRRRQVLLDARNRREQDMLRALADVEHYERRIADVTEQFDALFDERDLALTPAHA